jgi:hypothetical protein
MAARVRVSERDLRALLAVVSGDRGGAPAEGVPPSLLADLAGLIRCDIVTLAGLDSDQKVTWFAQGFPPETSYDHEDVFWRHYWTHESCCYPDRTGDLRTVTKRSDFFSPANCWPRASTPTICARSAPPMGSWPACPPGPGR